MTKTEVEECALEARDEAARTRILYTLSVYDNQAREARELAYQAESAARRLRAAVKSERWWELEELFGNDIDGVPDGFDSMVESLCEVSPVDLLGE